LEEAPEREARNESNTEISSLPLSEGALKVSDLKTCVQTSLCDKSDESCVETKEVDASSSVEISCSTSTVDASIKIAEKIVENKPTAKRSYTGC